MADIPGLETALANYGTKFLFEEDGNVIYIWYNFCSEDKDFFINLINQYIGDTYTVKEPTYEQTSTYGNIFKCRAIS